VEVRVLSPLSAVSDHKQVTYGFFDFGRVSTEAHLIRPLLTELLTQTDPRQVLLGSDKRSAGLLARRALTRRHPHLPRVATVRETDTSATLFALYIFT